MKLHSFIAKHIPGLRLLSVSMDTYVPGVILDPGKMRLVGHCSDVLPEEPESSWRYSSSNANMLYGVIRYDRKVHGRTRFLGLFNVSGSYADDLQVHLAITDIRGASLQISQIALHPKLNELRRIDRRGRWRQINNRFVVTEAFYAREAEVSFYRKNKIVGQADLENICRLQVDAKLESHWESDKSLVIANHDKVPFGVRGFTV